MSRWAGRRVTRIRAWVLARDFNPVLGYTPCYHCSKPASTTDHYPISRMNGGTDDPDNLVAACEHCNYSRGAIEGNRARREVKPSRQW